MTNRKRGKASSNAGFLKKKYHVYVFFGLLILLNFGGSLQNDFALDDNYYVANPNVQEGWSGMGKLFSQYTIKTQEENHGYRPMTALTFALEVAIWGEVTPVRAHLINLLLYFAVCVLLFKVLCALFPSDHRWTALIAVLIFLIHPIHTEVIFNIKCRDELLACLVGLLAFRLALRFLEHQKKRDLVSCFVLLIGALLCKPTAIPFLMLIPFSLWYFKGMSAPRTLVLLIPLIAFPFFLGKVINKKLIQEESHREFFYQENPLYVEDVSLLQRIPLATYTMARYVGLHVFPFPLSSYYGYSELRIMSWKDWQVWLSAAVILILVLIAFLSYRRKPILAFGLFWFLTLLAIYSNLLRPAPGMLAERFVFVASIGFSIVVGYGLNWVLNIQSGLVETIKANRLAATLIIVLCAECITWNTIRASHWENELTLFRRDVQVVPQSAKMHMLLANHLYKEIPNESLAVSKVSMVDEAVMHYQEALDIYSEYAHAWNNLGTMYASFHQDYAKAIHAYREAIRIRPEYPIALYSLAYCYEQIGDTANALRFYNQTIRLDENFVRAFQRRDALLRK